jgi:hypothetical protein
MRKAITADLRHGIEVQAGEMYVGVEQSGHQRPALAVDHPSISGTGSSAACGNPCDALVFNDDARVWLWIAAGAIEQRGVLEDEIHGVG